MLNTDKKIRKFLRTAYVKTSRDRFDPLVEKAREAGIIASRAENNRVCVLESGRDCDGVQYSGLIHEIPASVVALDRLREDLHRHADGPFWLTVVRPSEARNVRYESRDLGMEAFENGHPWVLRP